MSGGRMSGHSGQIKRCVSNPCCIVGDADVYACWALCRWVVSPRRSKKGADVGGRSRGRSRWLSDRFNAASIVLRWQRLIGLTTRQHLDLSARVALSASMRIRTQSLIFTGHLNSRSFSNNTTCFSFPVAERSVQHFELKLVPCWHKTFWFYNCTNIFWTANFVHKCTKRPYIRLYTTSRCHCLFQVKKNLIQITQR